MTAPIKVQRVDFSELDLDEPPGGKRKPAPVDTGGCMLMLPQPGGGHRMCGKPLHDLVFCKEHA